MWQLGNEVEFNIIKIRALNIPAVFMKCLKRYILNVK